MKYHVVETTDVNQLMSEVNQLLNVGWKLHGSLVINRGMSTHYYQALIYEEAKGGS